MGRKKIPRKCDICHGKYKGDHNSKYCPACGRIVQIERSKRKSKIQYDYWKNLPDGEKLRRMNIAAQMIIDEEQAALK